MVSSMLDRPEAAEKAAKAVAISVLMPCLNESRTVATCVTKAARCLREIGVRAEIIVADNGSSDGSPAIAQDCGARVIHIRRKGYGEALRGGINAARGEFIIMADADDSYDFGDMAGFVARLLAGDDLVMGNRFRGGIKPGAMPWHHRYIGNPVLTGILNLFYRTGVGDAHCGFRAFRKDAFERMGLKTTGMEFASEMVVRAAQLRMKVSEVPVVLHRDGRDRPPHLRTFRDGWRHLRFLLLFCPLWLFVIPAGVLMAFSLGLMVWLTPGMRFVGSVGFDVHTMVLGSLGAILGYQMLWLGVFAKYLGGRTTALPVDRVAERFAGWMSLERGLIAGGAILAFGLVMNLALVWEWWAGSFGELDAHQTMRPALWGMVSMVLGAQTGLGAVFLELIRRFVPAGNEE